MRVRISKTKKKEGMDEVWWKMREVSRDYSRPYHFSNNQFFLGILIQFVLSSHDGPCPS